MSVQNRLKALERVAGDDVSGVNCPVCDAPARETEKNYDENIWGVLESIVSDFDCVYCGRPRQFKVDVLGRKDERVMQ